MTNEELIEILKTLPQDESVWFRDDAGYLYQIESVTVRQSDSTIILNSTY